MKLPKDIEKKRDNLTPAQSIYEPKYGGKDHSGYDTKMLYEINYEREECFENGFNEGVQAAFESEAVRGLVEALELIKNDLDQIGITPTEICHMETARGALAKFNELTGTVVENE